MIVGKDGIDHINVYSKGQTELGRLLSNFAHTPFWPENKPEDRYESVEGWWYWYSTGMKHDSLKRLFGFEAKKVGRSYSSVQTPTKEVLVKVYSRKIECNPQIQKMLVTSTLPFTHYYAFGGKIVETKWEWTGALWNEVREIYREMK